MLQSGFIRALGTMSGTSLDGVDAAIVITDGITIRSFGPSAYRPYAAQERATLQGALGLWQSDDVAQVQRIVEAAHLDLMKPFGLVDIAGFHGQTLAHDPGGRGTHQCGDGAVLARTLGYPVAWDFRSADVAAGGQGAPLVPFYHFALARWIGATAPIAFLNLGGVGNITWVNPQVDDPSDPDALLAFDTGPANAPINDLMQARLGLDFDADGALAGKGVVDQAVVAAFLTHPYFKAPAPKSLDRDSFAGLMQAVAGLSDADALASLAQIVVQTVAQAVALCPTKPAQLLVTGGGRRNATVMAGLSDVLDCAVHPVEEVGLDGDMLEAQAFAYLAVRVARGLPLSSPQTTGVARPQCGGVLSGVLQGHG